MFLPLHHENLAPRLTKIFPLAMPQFRCLMSVLQLCCKGTKFSWIVQIFRPLFFKKMSSTFGSHREPWTLNLEPWTYPVTHLPTYPLMTSAFSDFLKQKSINIIYIIIYIILIIELLTNFYNFPHRPPSHLANTLPSKFVFSWIWLTAFMPSSLTFAYPYGFGWLSRLRSVDYFHWKGWLFS